MLFWREALNIDVATTVKVILVLLGIAAIVSLTMAVKSIKAGYRLLFFQKRQLLVAHGWRLVLLALGLLFTGLLLIRFGEPMVYRYFPPSPTITQTPTVTITPTVTNTPSMTYTPTITLTLSQTYTPSLPEFIQATIQTPVGPDANAIFSPLSFSDTIKDGVVTTSYSEFELPVGTLFGGFSYDRMAIGAQWTALWFYGDELICSETKAWNYAPGGYGYTDCSRPVDAWRPGIYEVRIFVGQTWKQSGTFKILGEEPLVGNIPTSMGAQEPVESAVTATPPPTP